MKLTFTKMQGAGNDFVVLDETQGRLGLSAAQYRWLADRHFGVGADQILSVRPPPSPEVDFEYVIHNADGGEVEHCGNGARCFVRYVHDQGLTQRNPVRVRVKHGDISLTALPDARVVVDMGAPRFRVADVPFDPQGVSARVVGDFEQWPLVLATGQTVELAVLSMGNPHAVLRVDDVDSAPVAQWGPQIQALDAFARQVNVGFMQVLSRSAVRLRVFERGAGETLACGTGACAAVVAGIRLGWLDACVDVHTRGGVLTIDWPGLRDHSQSVRMTGPATRVFEGTIEVPTI